MPSHAAVTHYEGMYMKTPGGRVWHIADFGEVRSLCGAFSRGGVRLALFVA
jgi:hypothetical protein